MNGPFEAQLGLLDEAMRAPLRAAIAFPSGAHEAVVGALTAVKWPPHTSPIPLPHELSIDGSAADEAEQVLDFCIEVLDGPDWFPQRGELPEPAKTALCLAVVRAGRPLAQRHERFLPFTGGSHTALVRECVAAIAEERRALAIAKAASHAHPAYAELLLLDLLVDVPEEPVLEALRATERGGRPRKIVDDALRALGREHPSIARLSKGKARSKTLALSFRPRPLPPFDAVPDLLARQLGPLLARAKDEGARDQIELFAVLDARGKHLYDLHLFCGDDGPVYRAGTVHHVASFSQGGATESDDEQLLDALDLAIYRWRQARTQPAKTTKRKGKKAAPKATTKKR